MWPNPPFTEEILNRKLHFLCSALSDASRVLKVNALFKTKMIRPSGEHSRSTREEINHTPWWTAFDIWKIEIKNKWLILVPNEIYFYSI